MHKFKRVLSLALALCMLLSVLPLSVFAVNITAKPANGTTQAQPFLPGTGGSNNFRIPGMVTLANGTLIAACDARWNHSGDGAGLDTIVSVSADNGENWTYTFANYLGDNGNTFNNLSTCIIDPGIGTDGTTAYLIADLWPAGIALNTSKYAPIALENGFDDDGHLLLRLLEEDSVAIGADGYNTMAGDVSRYTHYLDLDTLKLYAYGADGGADTLIEGYTVDAWFNITGGDGTSTNLFFADSPFQPYPTDFLYLTTSTDGLSWSTPRLLDLQAETEQSLLVGPGNGTYDGVNKHMVFTAYRHTGGAGGTAYECACLIWMDEDGSWHRSEDATTSGWSSEATAVVLDDGTVRVFYRDGYSVLRYTDFLWDADRGNYYRDPDATEVTTEAVKKSGCQLTSIKYSGQIDGKDAVLVACPADTGARADGRLYVFLLNTDNTMELAYAYDIIPDSSEYYAYSCISEMRNGDIALLYEGDNPATNGGAEIIFTTIDMDDVTVFENDARLNFIDIEVQLGQTVTFKDTTGNYSAADASEYDGDVLGLTVTGATAAVPAASGMYSGAKAALADCLYTLTAAEGGWYLHHTLSDGTVVYIDAHAGSGNYGYPNRSTASVLTLTAGKNTGTFWIKDDTGSLHLHKELETPYWNQCSNPCGDRHDLLFFRPAGADETGDAVFQGFVQVTDAASLEDGGQYLIGAYDNAGNAYILNPVLGGASATNNDHLAKVTGNAELSSTVIAFRGLKEGRTMVQVGANVYTVTVTEIPAQEVTVKATESHSFTLEGEYDASDVTGLNEAIAAVTLAVSGDVQVYGELRDSGSSGTRVELADSGYTFTAVGDGTWQATIAKDGSTWYVRPNSKGHSTNQTALTLTFNADGSVYLKDASHYLYVNRSSMAWDRTSSVSGYEPHITFYLYGAGEDAASPIPGYKLITAANQLSSGSEYLIAFYGADDQLYVMDPTTRTASAYNQMAAVVKTVDNAVTTVTITGVAEGSTTMTLAGTRYAITVLPENYDPIPIPEAENVYQGPALTITAKPENGTTKDQPFPVGAGGSTNFRIPGIVTLSDGTVIAATDARWNHTGDGAGLDTLVAVSTDNGANWIHTYANYLGDNGNTYNNLSTCIIDPAIGTNGTTAYLIADLFPAGIALNTSKYSPIAGENGFDDEGHLLLRDLAGDTVVIGQSGYNTMAAARDYNYYLDLDTYKICTANGTHCAAFTVDPYFNITYTDAAGVTHKTNLFFADSPFQPYPTDYLYLTTSADGLTWSVPKLLNLQEENEQTLLIGPGNGTYDAKTGRMVFTAYEYTSGYQRTSLIWEDADGNWHRTEDATGSTWSSEASVVALADGTLRVFYRDAYSILRYTDYIWSAEESNYVCDDNASEVETAATKTYNNQLSAIVYSQPIEGKSAILVSTANTGTNARRNGYLYVFLVNDDKTLELAYAYDINEGDDDYYAYSCITELNDHTIGLVYEDDDGGNGTGRITYRVLDMDEIAVRDNDARLNFVDVSILTGESETLTDASGDYTGANTDELNRDYATVTMEAESQTTTTGQLGSSASYDGAIIDLADCLYTFAKNDAGVWVINSGDVYLNTNGNTGYPHGTAACTFTIEAGKEEGTFYIRGTADSNEKGDANYLYFDRTNRRWDRVNNLNNNATWMTNCSMSLFRPADGQGTGEIPGYDKVTALTDVTEGQYLIGAMAADGNWYVAYPSTVETTRYNQIAKVAGGSTITTTRITFNGVAEGYTEVVIGSTVYRVTVREYDVVDVTVAVGGTTVISDAGTGELTGPDTKYATARLADGSLTITGAYPGATSVILGRVRYDITVTGSVVRVELTQGGKTAYVIPGTDADMTQPDTTVAATGLGTGLGAQLGSGQGVYAGSYAALADCLYTFTANDNGTWTVSATAADGSTVYLQPYASNNGYPHTKNPVNVTVSDGYTEDSVYLFGNNGYLFFWRDGKNYYDRVDRTSGFEAAISFHLYRPAAADEASSQEIPGYVRIQGADALTEGQYLIAAAYNGSCYLAYPSLSTANRCAQIAQVVSDAATVEITGVAAGQTAFRVGSTVYDITVTHRIPEITTAPAQDMAMSFVVDTANLAGSDHYAVITQQRADDRGAVEFTVDQADWVQVDGSVYSIPFNVLAAKEMADALTVVVYDNAGNVVSTTYEGSMRDHIMGLLAAETDAAVQTYYVDLLNYGAEAQLYFDYNKDDPANNQLSAEQQSWATTDVSSAVDPRANGAGYAGSSLTLGNTLELNFVFNKSTVKNDTMYAVVTRADGTTVTIEGKDFKQYSATRWYFAVECDSMGDMGGVMKVEIFRNGTEATEANRVTFAQDSIQGYGVRMQAKKPLYEAVLKLSVSAAALK